MKDLEELALRLEAALAPREVDEALVNDLRYRVSKELGYYVRVEEVEAILAALPPLVQPPVVLTDEECDRIARWYPDCGLSKEGVRDGVRALLAAAGRYVAPPRRITREELEKAHDAWNNVDGNNATDGLDYMAAALQVLGFEVEGACAGCEGEHDSHYAECPAVAPKPTDTPPRRLTKEEEAEIESELGWIGDHTAEAIRILARALAPKTEGT